jgi:hypothetical protein
MSTPDKLNLPQWLTATAEQRGEWLEDGRYLDSTSALILAWAVMFQDHGAHISDETMISAYLAYCAGHGIEVKP